MDLSVLYPFSAKFRTFMLLFIFFNCSGHEDESLPQLYPFVVDPPNVHAKISLFDLNFFSSNWFGIFKFIIFLSKILISNFDKSSVWISKSFLNPYLIKLISFKVIKKNVLVKSSRKKIVNIKIIKYLIVSLARFLLLEIIKQLFYFED